MIRRRDGQPARASGNELEIFGLQARLFAEAGHHRRADLLPAMEGEDIVGEAVAFKDAM